MYLLHIYLNLLMQICNEVIIPQIVDMSIELAKIIYL